MDAATNDFDFVVTSTTPESPEPEPQAPITASTPASNEPVAETKEPAADNGKPLDKRTREGRIQSYQQQLDELTAKKHRTTTEIAADEARRDALRQEIAELEAKRTPQTPPREYQAPAEDDPEPTQDQFANDPSGDPFGAWLRKHNLWSARQAVREASAEEQKRQMAHAQQREMGERAKTFSERLSSELQLENPNPQAIYAAMASKGVRQDILAAKPLSMCGPDEPKSFLNAIAEVVVNSPKPVEMALELGRPEHFQRLSTLKPLDFFEAIGEIKQRLAVAHSGPIANTQTVSAAKPPIKPVGSSPVVSDVDADDADDLSEGALLRHIARENKRDPRINRSLRH